MASFRTKSRKVAWTCLGLISLAANAARAQDTSKAVRIGITVQTGTRPGVLVLPVSGPGGDSVRAMIQRDLEYSDRINVIAPDSMFADAVIDGAGARGQFNYPLYARLGAVVMLQVKVTPSGLQVAVHNVAEKKVARTQDFPLEGQALSPEWRMSVHTVSDELQLWITYNRGIAATRIVYVDDNTRQSGRVWQIDSDGANPTPLTGAVHASSPAWHPRGSYLVYTTLPDAGSRIELREAGGATRSLATSLGGQNITPVFSRPDGSLLMFGHLSDNGTDLYATNPFSSDPARRVTVGRGIFDSVSPTFSPDGRRIAFTSTKSGHPEVYISDADGTNAEILTPNLDNQAYQTDPDWAPDGRLIAFQSQVAGNFQIATISLPERTVRRLTSEGVNENPSFAPDGRHIVFTSDRTGVHQLFVIDVETNNLRQLTHAATGAKHPAWSPMLRVR